MADTDLKTKEVQQIYNSALTTLYDLAKESKLNINDIRTQEAIKKEARRIVEGICPALNRILKKRNEGG